MSCPVAACAVRHADSWIYRIAGGVHELRGSRIAGLQLWRIEVQAQVEGVCPVLWMVEEVEEIQLELHLQPLRELEVFPQREVHIGISRGGADTITRASKLTYLEAIHSVSIRVEPLQAIAGTGATRLAGNTHWSLVPSVTSPREITRAGDAVDVRGHVRA